MEVAWCLALLLIHPARTQFSTTTEGNTCPTGLTGPSSGGGSCAFSGSLCEYTNDKNSELVWALTGDGEMYVNTFRKSVSEKATLQSPMMCEEQADMIRLTFSFRFSGQEGGKISVQKCDPDCYELFNEKERDGGDSDWHKVCVSFQVESSVEIMFIGKKYKDDALNLESDIYLDNTDYKQGTCATEAPMWTLTTRRTLTSGTAETRDHQRSTDWTTRGSGSSSNQSQVPETTFAADSSEDGRTKDGQKERKQQEKGDDGDDKGDVRMIAGIVCLLLGVTVVTAIALKIFFVRRRKSQSRTEEASQPDVARYRRNHSLVMVTNDLFFSVSAQAPPASNNMDNKPEGQTTEEPVTLRTEATDDVYYTSVKNEPPARETTVNNTSVQQSAEVKQEENPAPSKCADFDYENVTIKSKTKEGYENLDTVTEYDHLNESRRVQKHAPDSDNTYDRVTN